MTARVPAPVRRRARVRVQGTVQGVGFRPFAYRLAAELGLGGFVLNDSHGVLLEIEGGGDAVAEFLARLERDPPPLAVLDRVRIEERPLAGDDAFTIARSPHGGIPDAPVTADSATCPDCLRELFDPHDRRFRYPFINCTNCGPRFTIVIGVPYDRPLTTMAPFEMCDACRSEYEDPADRRFHAQPNACPHCGPSVKLVVADGRQAGDGDPVGEAARALRAGAIVAIKGIGGYHLACVAHDEEAVSALRARKHREDKPFAVMAPSVAAASTLAELGEPERGLLVGYQRPIVLAPRLPDAPVASAVAPGAPELGLLLPYSPLHHLLLAQLDTPLVMTSGNVSDEPIAYRDQDALARLAGIADLFLVHNRPIETRTDDSVVRMLAVGDRRQTTFLRRSRGYVPASVPLPPPGTPQPLLACGAELKSTFCLAKGDRAWISHHIGDLENYETLRSFTDGIEHFRALFAVEPEVVAHDRHPEYLSTKYALDQHEARLIAVQHHHAHLAACLAEHAMVGPAVGAIFDGTGYGTDGTVWGGELLLGDAASFRRLGMLAPVAMPGGARAIRQPWRMACAWLCSAFADRGTPAIPKTLSSGVDPSAWKAVCGLAATALASPPTTSMGRLFDAVAAIAGIRATVNYEGQAAIEFEAACDPGERGRYEISLSAGDAGVVIDPRTAIREVVDDVRAGLGPGVIAARFHTAVAQVTVEACARLADAHRSEHVVLSGGVFQNRRLLESVSCGLCARGLRVLVPERLPVNDGGIAYGQAVVAAARLRSGVDEAPVR